MATTRIGLGRAFAFEASHHLENYEGKCSRVHGHSYHGSVLVSALFAPDAAGIVLDFSILKAAIQASITERYDHRDLNECFTTPTAERIVECIALDLQTWFNTTGSIDDGPVERQVPAGIRVERVKLYETANCLAIWSRELNHA